MEEFDEKKTDADMMIYDRFRKKESLNGMYRAEMV